MAFEFVQLQAPDQQDVIDFLLKSFGAAAETTAFRPHVMHWKYFSEHPDWAGTRSFAVKKEHEIVAHGGIWPVTLVTPQEKIKAIHLIDWAASRTAVGAGVQLLRKVAQLGDVLITIGGSPDTQAVLPKLGYKRCGELRRYARVVRPWLQFRTTPRKTWKTALKLLLHSATALTRISVPNSWEVSQVHRFGGVIEDILPQVSLPASSQRTRAELDHLLDCSAGRFSGFVVQRGRLRGYFLIAQIGRQARIVDIGINSQDQECWQAFCMVAAHTAAQNPEICEIVAGASQKTKQQAWLQSGFSHRRTDQILCYDPHRLLGSGGTLDLSMADGDICFLNDPAAPYLS